MAGETFRWLQLKYFGCLSDDRVVFFFRFLRRRILRRRNVCGLKDYDGRIPTIEGERVVDVGGAKVVDEEWIVGVEGTQLDALVVSNQKGATICTKI